MLKSVSFRRLKWILLAGAVAMLAGCAPKTGLRGHAIVPAPPGTISAYELANRLGMTVADSSPSMTVLRGPTNTVVIYPDPGGQVYINGKAMAKPTGGIITVEGVLYLPEEYESAIRANLHPYTVLPPQPVPAPYYPTPRVRHHGAAGIVVVDPGHGGQDPGATSVRGDREKIIVLDVARSVAERLAQAGVDVRMTREGDQFIDLNDRAAVANRCKADLFVSIHADYSTQNHGASGFTCYVSRAASRSSDAAADTIARRLQATGLEYRGRKEANYRVLVTSCVPAVLVELGFLSNRTDAAMLSDDAHRQRVATAIADGIIDYLQNN